MTNDNKRKCSAFVARFFVTFFLTGSIKFGAVLFDPVSRNDGFTSALTGLLFILPYATSRLLGPGVNYLMNYFSPRFLASLGGFIFGAGYVCSGLCRLCPLYLFIFLTMSGMGLACMLLPTVLCLKSSFRDNFRAIMPIAMLGSFAGVAVIPTVTVFVLNSYGTSVCLILFGASAWNLVPCGLLLQADHLRKEHFKSEMINLQQKSYHDPASLRHDPTVPQEETLKSAKDCHGITGAIKSLLTSFLSSMKQLANFNFVMFFIVANVRKIPNDAWMLYLIPHTIARGLSPTSAATVGSIGGIGGLLGRLVASISFKTTRLIPILLFSIYFILNGMIFIGMEIWGYSLDLSGLLYVASFLNGTFLSAQSGMIAGILHLLVTPENYLLAFATVDAGNGVWALLAGYGPGLLLDKVNGGQTTFLTLGCCSGLCGLIVIFIWFNGNSEA